MLLLLVLCGLIAAIVCGVLLRVGRRAARRYALDNPQRFHVGHVPRLGGVAMLASCLAGWAWMVIAPRLGWNAGIQFEAAYAVALALVAVVASVAGIAEDITHRVGPFWRLLFCLAAGVAAVTWLGVRIDRLGFPALDAAWRASPWPSIVLSVFAIAGLPHAFNLIDGYNGLAGSVAAVCCFALAYVALQLGDRQLAGTVVVLAGATGGFLLWNYPRGLIFAGDGGAYLWGVVIGVACITLVQRHAEVSPWFPMLLLAYPVLEVAFSIYRKVIRGQSPSMADALHIHQLIYRRIVREVFHDDEARRVLMRNNRTTPYLWGFAVLTVIPAALFWQNTRVLIAFTVAFVALYVWAYTSIIRFRVPGWVRRGR